MEDLSILETTKRSCGIEPDDTDYDVEIIGHINATFFVLEQLGVGSKNGFVIFDATTKWSEFIDVNQMAAVVTYMGLRVRLLFDPPPTGPAIEAMERQAGQLEWRLNAKAEEVKWEVQSQTSLLPTVLM